jgi:prolyl-tRNA editing enzyme YbaK/EbsC (Cys-tRNA(Pro) deacylase)
MQPHQAAAVLGVAHVQQQLARARARSAAVVASDAVPAHAARVKSMVLVLDAAGSAVLVLLLAGHRVDLRAVGEHLQLPRGCTRLATPGEAVAATGCALGCIPPLGHSTQLRMLVDTHLAALPPQQLVCAGAGQAGVQLVLPAAELLSAAVAAQVGGFSTTKLQQPPQDAEQQQQQQQQLTAQQLEQGLRAAAAQMPQPWAEGAEVVQLVGVIAQRRR